MREDRVIAVLSLESQDVDVFTEANVEFIRRVAIRAAAALDNANLLQETRRERQKLEIILGNITDAVIVTDHEHKLVLVNHAAMAAFHLPPKENYAGRAFSDVFMNSALLPLYRRSREQVDGLAEELPLSDKRTLHVSIVPVPQVGWSIVAHDITHFKETDKLKNELLATTSHDLKNPLSTILGYADLIGMTNQLNEQGLEYMSRVHGAVKHMRQLIDDLLDMARIESGIHLKYSDLQLRTMIDTVLNSFTPQIDEKQMQVAVKIPSDLPPVPADEARISQVLTNLISNAIKYTPPEGHIQISGDVVDGSVRVTVQDDGLGIGPEDQAQVFARFFRVRTPETDDIDGTGLGLAIVRSLIELHGGQIGLRSRLGEGSTFFFTLPLVPPIKDDDADPSSALISDASANARSS
jgi:signal transduction histidine kinase